MRITQHHGEIEITFDDGGYVAVCDYDPMSMDGLDGELADGATFTAWDGCTAQRRGDKVIWITPPEAVIQEALRARAVDRAAMGQRA